MSRDGLGLFDTPPNRPQIRFGLAIVGLLFAAFLLILPIRDVQWREIDAFIPMVDAIMFLGELITATMLYAQASLFRSKALTVLATGYVLGALLLIPHLLTFPGAVAPHGLLGAGADTTPWIYTFRRTVFPIAVILYVQLKRADSATQPGAERPAANIAVGVLATLALAAAVTLLTTLGKDLLPPYYHDRPGQIYANAIGYQSIVFALNFVATALLFRKRSSVLDLWLLVAFSGWLIQSLMFLTVVGRFTAGWYCLFAITLFCHLVVMLALIAESNRLYARLARSTSAWQRERDARLMSMDALAAAIAHEVGQPLSAVSSNGMAGLHWLTGKQANPERAARALRAAIDAGQRAADVIKSIRALFAKRLGTTSEFNLNDLVRETASLLDRELAGAKVSLRLALDDALPPILADRTQLRQVLLNLFTNAIESLAATQGRPRQLAIRSAWLNDQAVLVEVSDTGLGIGPAEMAQVFDAFFTTKAAGTGLGLSLCRTIVEEHGGRLWASRGEPCGATFHLQLPRGGLRHDHIER